MHHIPAAPRFASVVDGRSIALDSGDTPLRLFWRIVSRSAWVVVMGLLALAANSASALTLCADSGPTLNVAFSVAAIANEAVTIRIASGTYPVPGSAYSLSAPTTLLGGYDAGCVHRAAVIKASDTVIDFGGAGIAFNQNYGTPTSLFAADGISFVHASSLVFTSGNWGDEGNIRFTRSRISGVPSSSLPLEFWVYGQGTIEMDNVLLDHMASGMPSGDCAVRLLVSEGGTISLKSVTADVAPNKNFCLDDNGNGGHATFLNSIIWSSVQTSSITNVDALDTIDMINTTFFALNRHGANGQTASALHEDPQWADATAGDYRLTSTSSSVNSGTPIVPGGLSSFDIDGNARWQGQLPDRGAYESPYQTAQTYTVTTTADSGVGSLRDAMTRANEDPNLGIIQFAIPGGCPRVITLATTLPKVLTPMLIDGTSQPGWVANTDDDAFLATLCVVVKPASGTMAYAFHVPAAADSGSLTLRGVALGGFQQPVILAGGSGHVLAGNRFGGFFGTGIDLPGATFHSINVTPTLGNGSFIIGGPATADRNLISKSAFSGINVQAGVDGSQHHCQIVNNLIGTSPSGNTAAPNFTGIVMAGNHCLIDANRIVGNTTDGIVLSGAGDTLIQRNIIGLTTDGNGLQNSGAGIRFTAAAAGNVVGAPLSTYAWGFKNTVRFMANAGIQIESGTDNTIRSNEIGDNGIGGDGLDIDLGADGPTPNDVDVANAPFANRGQNFPLVSNVAIPAGTPATATNVSATVTAKLDSAPGNYRMDAYFTNHCGSGVDARGHADAYLGGTTADNLQVFTFVVALPNILPTGYVSFTATDHDGNTSEMGTCYPVVSAGDTIFKNGFEG